MRTSLFLVALIICLFIGRYTPLYECSAATIAHEKVTSFLLVDDDTGNEQIIQEMNNYNITYEKAIIAILPNEEKLLSSILDTISDFTLDYTIGQHRYVKSSDQKELCLENFVLTVDRENIGIMDNKYLANVTCDLHLYDNDTMQSFTFDSKSSFHTTGITTEFFINASLTEFFLDQLHNSIESFVRQGN